MTTEEVITWLINNWELVAFVLATIISIIGTTNWGRSHREALEIVTDAIESLSPTTKGVKTRVTSKRILGSISANKKLEKAINKARDNRNGE